MQLFKSKGLLIVAVVIIAAIMMYAFRDETGLSATLGLESKKTEDKKSDSQETANGSDKEDADASAAKPPELKEQEIDGQPSVTSKTQATEVLKQQKTKLGLGENDDLTISGNSADKHGNEYYHVTQTYKGIPVYGRNSTLEVENGKAVVINGSWDANINLDIKPKYDAKQAVKLGLEKSGVTAEPDFSFIDEPTLNIFISAKKPHLAWKAATNYKVPQIAPEVLFVDAHDPQILFRVPLEHTMERQ